MLRLDLLERLLPVVAEAHLARGLLELDFAPGKLLFGDGDELLGRVGNELVVQVLNDRLPADRVAHDRLVFALLDSDDFLAKELDVFLERSVDLLVGRLAPPGKERVVPIVELEPLRERRTLFLQHRGATVGHDLRRPDRLGVPSAGRGLQSLRRSGLRGVARQPGLDGLAGPLDLEGDLGESLCGGRRIDRVHAAARVIEGENRSREGHERGRLGDSLLLPVEKPQVVVEAIGQKEPVDPALDAERGKVDRVQPRPPGLRELAQGPAAVGGILRVEVTQENIAVRREPLDDVSKLRRGGILERRESGNPGRGVLGCRGPGER